MKNKSLLKLVGAIGLAALIAIPFAAGCAAPAPAPAPAPPVLPTLNWVLQHTETTNTNPMALALIRMADDISARTEGKFNIRLATVGELGIDAEEVPKALSDGTIEMTNLLMSMVSGFMPQMAIYDLPYLSVTGEDVLALEAALHEETVAAFKKLGYEPVSEGAFYVSMPQDIISRYPIDDWTDLDGLKVRIWRALDGELISAMGGEGIYMSGGEVYMALQRGVIDAVVGSVEGHYTRKLHEVAKYYYPVSLPRALVYIAVNSDKMNNLPEEYKTMLQEGMDKAMQEFAAEYEASMKAFVALLVNEGVKVMEVPDEGRKAWRAGAAPIWDEWAKEDPRNREALDLALRVF